MSSRLLQHIIFWISIFIVWTFMKSGRFSEPDELLIGVINTMSYAMVYYGLTRILIARYFDKGRMVQFGIGVVFLTFITISLWYLLIKGLLSLMDLPSTILPKGRGSYVLESIQLYVPGFILLAWESYTTQKVEEERLHKLEKESISSELNYLKARINPSFLLDTLKNIKQHIKTNSQEAPKMILSLSGILDYVLYKSQNKTTSIEEEMMIIKSFVNLTSLQGNFKMEFNYNIEGILSKRISPLVLLSTVEQALKSVNLNCLDKINISLLSTEYKLDFKINLSSNSTLYINHQELNLIDRQLLLSYQEQHSINTNTTISTVDILLVLNHQYD